MTAILAGRCLGLLPVLLGVSVLVFLATEWLPGDVAVFVLGEKATEEQLAAYRERTGLDRPLPVRYLRYLGGALTGDLGRTRQDRPVAADIAERFPATLELAFCGMAVAVLWGLFLGLTGARFPHTGMDRAALAFSLAGVSIPVFWLGLVLLQAFAVQWPVLPLTGRLPAGHEIDPLTGLMLVDAVLRGRGDILAEALRHLALPALTLGLVSSALLARLTRAGILEESSRDYLLVCRAKGLSERRIFLRTLRGSCGPLLTVGALEFGTLLGGAVVTETVFAWPGLGTYLVDAILARDIHAVQGAVLVTATAFVLANLAADLLTAALDPRVRHG